MISVSLLAIQSPADISLTFLVGLLQASSEISEPKAGVYSS